jgi:hypothetical protein
VRAELEAAEFPVLWVVLRKEPPRLLSHRRRFRLSGHRLGNAQVTASFTSEPT